MSTPKKCKTGKSSASKRAVFTSNEELKLLEFIEKERHVIENKTTNKIINEDKDMAWKRVTDAYNAVAVERRTLEQLRANYDNLKTKSRKIVAEKRSYVRGTGGGGERPEFDPVIELMLKIINLKTVMGLDSEFDCDNDRGGENDEMNKETQSAVVNITDPETVFATISDQLVILEIDESSIVNACSSEIILADSNAGEVRSEENLEAGVAAQEVLKIVEEPLAAQKRTWNKYTPRCLKEPMSKKLRPIIPNPVYDKKQEYYTKKCENVDHEIIARNAQEKRLAEEHERKMQLLALEIRLKQEELKLKYNVSV